MMRRGPIAWTLFGVLPILLTLAFTVGARHQPAFDFRALWQAGRDVSHGHDPYPAVAGISANPKAPHDEFIYPAPVAVAMVPLGVLPFGVAAGLFVALLIVSVIATLRLLGVRDPRCYGVAFASVPVLESFRLGAVSPILALGLAAAWSGRDRRWMLPAVVTALVVAKLFLWPLFVWLLAARRWGALARSAALTVAVGACGWAIVGFGTLASYPAVLRRMTDVQFRKSYGVDGLVAAVGTGTTSAHAAVLLCTLAGIAAIAAAAWRAREPELGYCVTIVVSLLASPLVWLHYDSLLLVPVAIASARLSPLWLLPLVLWATPTPESGGTAWRIALPMLAATLAVCAPRLRGFRGEKGSSRWGVSRGAAQPGWQVGR